LLSAVRALVAPLCGGSNAAAERFVLDLGWHGGLRSCRWSESDGGQMAVRTVRVARGGTGYPRSWHPNASSDVLGIRIEIDWETSTVSRIKTAPDPLGPGRYLVGHLLRPYLSEEERDNPFANRITQTYLVHLSRDELVAALRAAHLLPPAPAAVPAITTTAAPPSEPEVPAVAEPPARLLLSPTQSMIMAIIRRQHRKRIPEGTTIARLTTLVENGWAEECERQKLSKSWPPAPKRDAVKDALTRAGVKLERGRVIH
jgi:hypothetical protein